MIKAILLAALVPCMTQHRNMTPSMEVSTNLYGSVTGIVDKTYVTNAIGANVFQEKLVSGTNIKTVNGNSLLGSGNIEIQGGGGGGGTSPSVVTNIAENVVTNNVNRHYLCTEAVAQSKADAARDSAIGYARDTFLRTDTQLSQSVSGNVSFTKNIEFLNGISIGHDESSNERIINAHSNTYLTMPRKNGTIATVADITETAEGYYTKDQSDGIFAKSTNTSTEGLIGTIVYPEYAEENSYWGVDWSENSISSENSLYADSSTRLLPGGYSATTELFFNESSGVFLINNAEDPDEYQDGTIAIKEHHYTKDESDSLYVKTYGVSTITNQNASENTRLFIENDAVTINDEWGSRPAYDSTTLSKTGISIYNQSTNSTGSATNSTSLSITVNGEVYRVKENGSSTTRATFKLPQGVTGNRTFATVEDDITSKADQSDVDTLNASVTAIAGHLNAEDARFVSTNYDYSSSIPEAYVEINMTQNNTSSWVTIWKEMTRWNDWTGSNWNWSVWSGFNEWKTSTENGLQEKANKNWGMYDSEKGTLSPDGYTQISSSNILLCSGMSYERTVTTDGAIWVLRCNNGTMHINGDTNGYFKIVDGDGNSQFEIVKGDRIELGADATGVRVDTTTSPQTLVVEYTIEGATEQPTIQVCDDLSTANWKPDTDPTCLATVTWTYGQGTWTARVQRKTAGDALFVKATYLGGSISYIDHKAPAKFDSIILNGVRYYLGTAVIDNNTVLTLSTTPPNN